MPETVGALILAGAQAAGVPGASVFGTFTLGGTGLTGAAIVGSAAILGATIGLQFAMRPSVPKPENGSQPLKQGIPPRIRAYGLNRLAGYYMAFEVAGPYSFDVLAIHSGRIGGIRHFYFHDDEVHLNPATLQVVGWGPRYAFTTVGYHLGNVPETAYFSPPFTSIWTADHRGDGIASVCLTCSSTGTPADFTKRYPRGLPQISAVADCAVIWNPWDPAQDRNDEATWQVSYNPVVQLIDYLCRADGGMGLDFDILFNAERLALWGVEAALCDELVDRADGTREPRYRCSGWFTYDTKPEDVVNNILSTCDGHLIETGDGGFALKVGVYREPTVIIEAKHFLPGFSLDYGQPDEQLVNQLDFSFTDPAQKFVEVQPEPYRDEDSISATGIVRAQQLNLRWVQSQSQAARLADRAMQRLNPTLTGTFTTDLNGLRAIGERWVRVRYPFVSGLQDDVVEIQGSETDLLGGKCVFQFHRIDTRAIEAYRPETDEGAPVVKPDTGPPPVPFPLAFNNRYASGYLAALEDI